MDSSPPPDADRATRAYGESIYDQSLDAPASRGRSRARHDHWAVGPALRLGRRLMGWALRRSDDLWLGHVDLVAGVLEEEMLVYDKATRDGAAERVLRRIFG